MSLPSPTGQRALNVPATPASPLTEASLGRTGQVLTQAPLGTQKSAKAKLALVADDALSPERAYAYFSQVYGWPTSAIVVVSSWDDVERELGACSSIGELVIFSHAVFDAVSVGGAQLTGRQFADRFKPVAPLIEGLSFDGCVFGGQLEGIHYIATQLKIPRVRGWTWWHALDWWRVPPQGDPAAALAAFQPLAAIASTWLPHSLDGQRVYTQAEQEPMFSAGKLNLLAEYFVGVLDDAATPNFGAAVVAGTMDPNKQRPRSGAPERLVDSSGAQAALEIELTPYPPLFARVVMTPWA